MPPDALRGRLRDQPVDGPGPAGRRRPGRRGSGTQLRRHLPAPRSHGRRSSTRSRACRTWSSRPTARPSSTASCSARSSATPSAPPRGRAYLDWFAASGLRQVHDAERGQRGRGRPAAHRAGTCSPAPASAPTWPPTPRRRSCSAARWSRLQLVDPRFYHLDTALCVLDDRRRSPTTRRRSPPASQAVLRQLFPDAILATEADAAVLGLNAVSDGRHVVLPAQATGAGRTSSRERGYEPDRRRPVRAAQGRRRPEVLHAGGARMTRSMIDRANRTAAAVEPRPSTGPRTTTTRCRS